jgi:membrane fusion protein
VGEKVPLFRQEAVEFQRHNRQWGEVLLLQPLSTKVVAWFIVAVVALIIAFLFVGQYSRKETVAGYLAPTAGTAKIFPPRQGVIKDIHIAEGQEVQEGQPLLTIETSQIAASGEDINAAILDTLAVHKDRLARQIRAEEQRTNSERERLTALLRGLETEIAHLRSQMAIQADRIRVSENLFAQAAKLVAKGYMPATELNRREVDVLQQKQGLNALHQQLATRENQHTETRYALEQLPTVMAEKIQVLRNELAETEQRIAEINGRRAYVIRAPAHGRVSALQATVGQNADPRHLQLEIIPADSILQAELFVPTRAIGFVKAGQAVRILYEAFPFQHFGTYSGEIVKVSQTILTSSDVSAPVPLKEPAYRVTVSLDQPDIDAYGKKISLQAGMLLKADIILEKRSLMNWLLDPLLSARF